MICVLNLVSLHNPFVDGSWAGLIFISKTGHRHVQSGQSLTIYLVTRVQVAVDVSWANIRASPISLINVISPNRITFTLVIHFPFVVVIFA